MSFSGLANHNKIPMIATRENLVLFFYRRGERFPAVSAIPYFCKLGFGGGRIDSAALGLLRFGVTRRPIGPGLPVTLHMHPLDASVPKLPLQFSGHNLMPTKIMAVRNGSHLV